MDNKTPQAHLKSTVKVRHLLGILPLSESDTLLHLLGLRLDFFPQRNETVDCSLECADEWLWIECCVKNMKTVSLRWVLKNYSTYVRDPFWIVL